MPGHIRRPGRPGAWNRATRSALIGGFAAWMLGACASPFPPDAYRRPTLPERMAPASTYPWVAPDDQAAVRLPPEGGVATALVLGDLIVMVEKARGVTGNPSGIPVRVRGLNASGRTLFTGPPLVAESGLSDVPHLALLYDGQRIRIAYSYHKTGPKGRLAYVDLYDPAARGDVRPVTVRMPSDDQLEWAAGTAIQGALGHGPRPITILDADGTLTRWTRPGRQPIAATNDLVVEQRGDRNDFTQGFEVVDRHTDRVVWSSGSRIGARASVYAVSSSAIVAGRTRHLKLLDLRTGKILARGNDPLPMGGTTSTADGTQEHGELLTCYSAAADVGRRWVHGGWGISYYAVWRGNLYGFDPPGLPFEKHPMALWISPDGTPHRFPVAGDAAPLGVTADGHAVVLAGNYRDSALYIVPLRGRSG